MRRAARRDDNEAQIIDTLRKMGWSVQQDSAKGRPDLTLGIGGLWVVLAEVKGEKGELTPEQQEWWKNWRGPKPLILRSVADAMALSKRVFRGESPWGA